MNRLVNTSIFKSSFIFLFLEFGFVSFSCAQSGDDAQFWMYFKLEKKVYKNLSIALSQQTRITQNFSTLSYGFIDVGPRYKLNKYFHFGASYVYGINDDFYRKNYSRKMLSNRHQYYGYVSIHYSYRRWEIINRCMIQGQVKDIYTSDNGFIPDYYYRNKTTVEYEITKKIIPYFSTDIYYLINDNSQYGNQVNRVRYYLGVNYRLSKRSNIDLYYLIQKAYNSKFYEIEYVVGLNYNYKF